MAGEPEHAGGSADAALPAAAAPLPCQKLSHRETVWPPESIDPNDAMILPHGANPDRMKFSERTGVRPSVAPAIEQLSSAHLGDDPHGRRRQLKAAPVAGPTLGLVDHNGLATEIVAKRIIEL